MLFSFFCLLPLKMLKMHILTSIWSAQHPNAGWNIQQTQYSMSNQIKFLSLYNLLSNQFFWANVFHCNTGYHMSSTVLYWVSHVQYCLILGITCPVVFDTGYHMFSTVWIVSLPFNPTSERSKGNQSQLSFKARQIHANPLFQCHLWSTLSVCCKCHYLCPFTYNMPNLICFL